MTLFDSIKLIHVLAAIRWVGGSILGTVYSLRARKADHCHRLGLARDLHFLGDKVFGPAAGVVFVFGVWMVIDRPAFAFAIPGSSSGWWASPSRWPSAAPSSVRRPRSW